MKLLVTGGAGFIGSNFIRYWLREHPEDEMINLDSLTYAGNLENLSEVEKDQRYTFIKGDITDEAVVAQAMAKVEAVVHFAAESHVDRSILSPEAFIQTNVVGTYKLLEAARQKNLRFHHVSTDEVYGSLPLDSQTRFNENSPYQPNSPYAASKAASDHLVRAYSKTYKLPVTISNTSNNFGPYQFPEKLIALAITNLIEGKKVPLYTPGNQVRDWIFVEDHCRGIDLILSQGKIGETYLLGGATEYVTNREVVEQIIRLMKQPETMIEVVPDRPGHDVRYAVDWSKAKKELGYQPHKSFADNLAETIDWYQTHEAWWRRVKHG
ncbi:dTDP-glucose 4,6-dehydratase [Microgenomates group bacterium RBG_16_45_19]|nr:MAG: dTDP-glucose 4,6-dehydratase [Microgenomates group bacterium RBG_16_45_19]